MTTATATETIRATPHRLAAAAAWIGAIGVAIAGLLVALLPQQSPFAVDMPGLLGFAGPFAGPIEIALALAALAALALRPVLPPVAARTALGVLGAAIAVTLPGSAIAIAGYLLAMALLVGVPVLLIVLALRRPLLGVPAVALLAVGVAAGELTGAFPISRFITAVLPAFGGVWVALLVVASHVIAAAGLLALAVPARGSTMADAVRRARVPLTIAAAACALPYVIARASWLTPWPMFGPTRELLDGSPAVFVTGLLLGSAMLTGAVLTLGLILPWGERFPGWVPRVGGRPVPVRLAVVPALLVAVLFTVGGIGILELGTAAQGVGAPIFSALTMALVLPFWLWGPLLALATWGYAEHRRTA